MSFDALTMSGLVAALLSVAVMVTVSRKNERLRCRDTQESNTD